MREKRERPLGAWTFDPRAVATETTADLGNCPRSDRRDEGRGEDLKRHDFLWSTIRVPSALSRSPPRGTSRGERETNPENREWEKERGRKGKGEIPDLPGLIITFANLVSRNRRVTPVAHARAHGERLSVDHFKVILKDIPSHAWFVRGFTDSRAYLYTEIRKRDRNRATDRFSDTRLIAACARERSLARS